MAENKMGTWPIFRLLMSVSLPIALSMLVQALYNIVDSIFVAMINEEALTAVSLAFPFQTFMNAVAIGLGVGMNSLLSRSLGERKFAKANRVGQTALVLFLIAALTFSVLGFLLAPTFFRTQTQDPTIVAYGTSYLRIVSFFSIGIFMQFYTERLLQATGQSFYSMLAQMVGAVLNIILDPFFIFGLGPLPRMGISGAATATVISQIIGALVGVYFNVKKNPDLHLDLRDLKPDLAIVKEIFEVGIPTTVTLTVNSLTIFLMNRILMIFSSTAVAAYGIYFKINSFIFMPVFGMNNGLVPIVAYNYGAGSKDRIYRAIRLAMGLALGIMVLGCILVQVFPQELLGLFSPSEDLMAIGVPMLRTISLSFPLAALSIVASAVFQALGRGTLSLASSLFRQIIILVPLAYLISRLGQVDLVWWANVISEGLALVFSLYLLRGILKAKVAPLGE